MSPWINILMDGPPAQSLGVEPVDPARGPSAVFLHNDNPIIRCRHITSFPSNICTSSWVGINNTAIDAALRYSLKCLLSEFPAPTVRMPMCLFHGSRSIPIGPVGDVMRLTGPPLSEFSENTSPILI